MENNEIKQSEIIEQDGDKMANENEIRESKIDEQNELFHREVAEIQNDISLS